jgi:hypothetical protein
VGPRRYGGETREGKGRNKEVRERYKGDKGGTTKSKDKGERDGLISFFFFLTHVSHRSD